jgi:hypothetical protein
MAITRKEALLRSISGGESANVSPITREEQYLSYIAGESNSYPTQPITREEVYLDKIAKSGVSGGSGVNVQSLSVTENGTYTAPSGVAYSPVFVDVETEEIPTQEKTVDITENGTVEVTADEGHLLSKVTANVNVGGGSSGENRLNLMLTDTLTEVTAEDLNGATKIGRYAFYARKTLKKAIIPSGVTEIEIRAFESCSELSEVILPDGLIRISDYAFTNCGFESFEMPDSVLYILSTNGGIFDNCRNLKTVKLSNSIKNMGKNTFNGCDSLENITLPASITKIDSYCFGDCTALKSVIIKAETPPSLNSYAFNGVPTDCAFYVPSASVEAYKAATNWAARADYIFAIEE